ncbi:hypothetical protein GCM10011352_20580 [Marinobacterium zhoushanense]|uniref:Uncharacterized protein n=1 Tax=Marinobacterium zhoushanense TaxID=1679163 RepID=A0ABQ1KB45_9GAMM|nr:hypothetical protein [Marinobacterium zhoushanense]GGB94416.1 hypothetical protein GCM10011352_20580 [Marinobacterium zhoushanense]
MKFSKEEKAFVMWWIDRQFANNPLFPSKCAVDNKEGKPSVSKGHVKAYKGWCKTAPKRSQIQDWIDEWLNKEDRKALKEALEAYRLKPESVDITAEPDTHSTVGE